METSTRWTMAAFGGVIAGLAAVASALGIFARGDGSIVTVTSARGITYEMATSGVYAYNAKAVVAEGIGWDVFTLVLIVPLTLATMYFVGRGSLRGRLVAIGLFGYFFYQYLEYAVTWAFGPLFPLFVGIFGLSLMGIAWFSVDVSRDRVAERIGSSFPRRAFVALNVSMAALLTVMWSGRIATGLGGDVASAGLYGETTLTVQALDLGLVVPIALTLSFLVWREGPVGYAGAAAYTISSLAMAVALVAMLVSSGLVSGAMPWPPILIFVLFFVGFAWVAARIYATGETRRPESTIARRRAAGRTLWVDRPADA